MPETVKQMAEDYKLKCDSAKAFIKDYLEPLEGSNLQKTYIYSKYSGWCKDNGIRNPETQRYFNVAMKDEGFRESVEAKDGGGSNRIWRNVRYNEDLV